jgi:hypothetical protein
MTASARTLERISSLEGAGYKYGFFTDIESEQAPPGLNEDTVRFISAKKDEPQWLLEWRLEAFRHWQTMEQPDWAKLRLAPIDYQAATYYSAPKQKASPNSLDEVDPELLRTYEKLGIPLQEQQRFQGIAVDAVFDSISVATTFKTQLAKLGVIFGSFGDAVREHPELVRTYLGSVVPQNDNFFAALNSAVFSDGSFAYIPPGVRCPMELSTYFRINAANSGQFERTLIIADNGSYVSYLEGCTAPQRDENQLHAAVVELVALKSAEIKYSTVQNWYPGDAEGRGGIYNFVTKRGACRGANAKISWTPGGDRLRHHLEVPELHPRGRQLGRCVLLGRHHEQSAAGGYRDQDDPYRQEYPIDDSLEGYLSGARTEHLSWLGAHPAQGPERAQLHPVRLAADWQQMRRPHRAVHRGPQPDGARRARGDDLEDQRRTDVLLPAARPLARGCVVAHRQWFLQRGAEGAADGVRRRGAEAPLHQP